MAGYKETPRQKMIAMLYLVLTALLALNVSKQILDAFLVVNESIETTNKSLEGSIAETYSEFAAQNDLAPEKVQQWYDAAMAVKARSDNMVDFIENVKAEVIAATDRIPIEEARVIKPRDIKRKSNFDAPTVYFISKEGEGGKEMALKLKNELNSFKSDILSHVPAETRDAMSESIGISTDGPYYNADNKEVDWETHHFYHTILTADLTILNKFIAEVRNAEAKTVAFLFQNVSRKDFTFDQVRAAVIPKSNYVLQGGQYEADIFLAALDSKTPLNVEIGGTVQQSDSGGVYKLVQSAGSVGEKTVEGTIKVTNLGTGLTTDYPFNTSYIVAPPSATVSATAMNVFFRGLDNPVSVSVPGVSSSKVQVSCSGGNIVRSGAGYIVKPGDGTKAVIRVSAEIDGKSVSMGSYDFRIKRVPTPRPQVNGKERGSISKQALIQHGRVTAYLEDFYIQGVKFSVMSFTFSAMRNGLLAKENITGDRLNPNAKQILTRVRPGSKVYFEDIRVKGPDGKTITLSPVILTVR